jgi:hypothetical protein
MTDLKNCDKYRELFEYGGETLARAPPLESFLGDSLITLINSEIGIGYISTLDALMLFLHNSYYYVRSLSKSKMLYDDPA